MRFAVLLRLDRIFGSKPLVPASLEGIDVGVSLVHQNECRTGTCTFIRSGAVENNYIIFAILTRP
jgi:hypothetical protein